MASANSASGRERPQPRPAAWLAALLAGGLVWYGATGFAYEAYDLGYSTDGGRAVVESWSVRLPGQYRLAWWRSTPHGPQDGLRLLAQQ